MISKEVVKHYRKAPPDLEKELNSEAKMLAHRLGIVDSGKIQYQKLFHYY